MKNNLKIGVIAGIVVAVALSAILSMNATANMNIGNKNDNNALPKAIAEQSCLTKEQALSKTSMNVKEPKQLPAGYELQCADANPYTVSLLYWNQPPIGKTVEKNNMVEQGAIAVTVERRDAEVDPAYYIKDRTKEIETMYDALGPEHNPRLTHILGNLALVREQCDSCGQQTATFPDGTAITNTYSLPTRIVFYDGDLWYIIEGNMPSAQLEAMAQTME